MARGLEPSERSPAPAASLALVQEPSAESRAQVQSRKPLTPAGVVALDEEPDVREVRTRRRWGGGVAQASSTRSLLLSARQAGGAAPCTAGRGERSTQRHQRTGGTARSVLHTRC